MERREFLKVSAAASLAAVAGLQSECTSKEVTDVEEPLFDYGKLYCSPEVMEDIKNCGADKADEQTKKEILAEEPQAKDLNENRYYNPHWNVNGSWGKANSRSVLISHLSGPNHGFKLSKLNQLSTDELQKLHDDDHDSKNILKEIV